MRRFADSKKLKVFTELKKYTSVYGIRTFVKLFMLMMEAEIELCKFYIEKLRKML